MVWLIIRGGGESCVLFGKFKYRFFKVSSRDLNPKSKYPPRTQVYQQKHFHSIQKAHNVEVDRRKLCKGNKFQSFPFLIQNQRRLIKTSLILRDKIQFYCFCYVSFLLYFISNMSKKKFYFIHFLFFFKDLRSFKAFLLHKAFFNYCLRVWAITHAICKLMLEDFYNSISIVCYHSHCILHMTIFN